MAKKPPTKKDDLALVVSDHVLNICFGRNFFDSKPRPAALTMTQLATRFSKPDATRGTMALADYLALDEKVKEQKAKRNAEKNGEYFIPAVFTHAGTRDASDVESISAFAGDIDEGNVSKEFIQAALKGLQYIAYSSYSHQTSNSRWRFIVPYSRQVTAAEHKKVFAFFQEQFDNQLDSRSETSNQIWYTPACPPDATSQFEFFVGQGDLLDVDSIIEMVPTTSAQQAAKGNPAKVQLATAGCGLSVSELHRLKDALKSISSDDRQVWVKVGLALRRVAGDEHGLPLWLDWSAKSAKFDLEDAQATWETLDSADREGGVTLGTVFHLAKEAGWTGTLPPPYVDDFNRCHFMAIDGGKTWVYREEVDSELNRPFINRIKPTEFRTFYANQKVSVQVGGMTFMQDKGTAWIEHEARRSYDGLIFLPGKPAPFGHYNLWQGFPIKPRAGNWSLFRQHIQGVVCAGDVVAANYLLSWMAWAVQNPDRPAEVAVVLRGARGTGKGKLAAHFGALFGPHSLQVMQSRHLTGNFNLHLRTCIFLFVDEALWAGDKAGENVLKGLITERMLAIEGKGQNVVTVPNRLHVMMASNNDWVVPAGAQERRYFVLNVGEQHMQDHKYFAAIDKQMLEQGGLEAMMFDLLGRNLSKFAIRQVPRTVGLDEQVLRSLDTETGWWVEHLGRNFTPVDWQFQSRWTLQASFASALGPNTHGRGTETRLGMFMRNVVPGGQLKKVTVNKTPGGAVACYEFPDQATCQQYLMQKLGLVGNPWV